MPATRRANDYLAHIEKRKTEESVWSREAQAEDLQRLTTVLVPFVDGVTQPLQRISRPLSVRVVDRPRSWKWSLQQQLKGLTSRDEDPGVIYRLKCNVCEQSFIGETARTACVRVKKHTLHVKNGRFALSVAEHAIFEQHALDFDNVKVILYERHGMKQRVKEVLCINAERTRWTKREGRNWTQSGSASSLTLL